MKTIIRQSVFETNSSSTHSLTIGLVKDFISLSRPVVIKMRDMDYLFKQDPSYRDLPEFDKLKTMSTREAIDYIFSDTHDVKWAVSNISSFLDNVGVKKGYKFNTSIWYSDKWEKEGKPALEHLKTAEYPQFDPEYYAPENDFKKKLEFLYCMALARGDKPVSYEDLSDFLKRVVERAGVTIKIEVPDIEICDENVLECPDSSKYEGCHENPEFQKEDEKYDKWFEKWQQSLTNTTISASDYTVRHYDRTLLEMSFCGYDYPLFMELHEDNNITHLRDMFKNGKDELLDWVFDKNSGFYRSRNG